MRQPQMQRHMRQQGERRVTERRQQEVQKSPQGGRETIPFEPTVSLIWLEP